MQATETEQQPQSEAEVEAQVRARQARRKKEEEAAEAGDKSPSELLEAAATGKKLSAEEVHDALELFLADDESAVEPKALTLNVGTLKKPKKIRWTIVPIDDQVIAQIRKSSVTGSRAQRRRGEGDVDDVLVARRIVARATVEPDMKALVEAMNEPPHPSGPAPEDAILKYFRKFGKTGLIVQISGEILNISGYDEEDISELDAASG
jgi:hypothetical protein